MSEKPNPYQPPAETPSPTIVAEADWEAYPDGRIGFEVALTEQDVKRYFPNPLPFGLLGFLIGLLIALMATAIGSRLILVLILLLVVLVVFVRSRMNWRMALRQTPRLLEPVSGYITRTGFYAASDGCRGTGRWEDMHAINATKDCLLMAGENWRLVTLMIPWTAFGDPSAAEQAMRSVISQREHWQPVRLGDPRLQELPKDEMLFPPEQPHVTFAGTVTFGEIAASGPGRKLKRTIYRLLPIPVILLVGVLLSAMGGLMTALLIGLPMLVFSLVFLFQLGRHPLTRQRENQVAFFSRGWFSDSGFFLQSATGQSVRQWRSVARQWHDDSMLCICLPGSSEGWFFFSRSQFASDDEFQGACQWSEAGLGEASMPA